MIKGLNNKQKYIICILLLVLITSAIFTITVIERKPYFGYLALGNQQNQSCTGHTITFLKNWFKEGAINLKFTMLINPGSIEFPDLNSRIIYLSYPPGVLIPIYIISKIANIVPGTDLVMGYNLANHFLIALFLALTCFIFLRKVKLNIFYSFLLAIIPILIELLTPGPLYWHQNVFWTDEVIILPFILLVFLEVLKDEKYNRKIKITIEVIQDILLFYGVLTDWLFVFVIIILYVKRIANKELGKNIKDIIKKTVYFFIPFISAILLYIVQISYYKMWSEISKRFFFLSAIKKNVTGFFNMFWFTWIKEAYGLIGLILLGITIIILFILIILTIYRYLKHKKNNTAIIEYINISALLTIPCLFQIYLFKYHSFIHNYSALKFSLALSLLPLAILPGVILVLMNNSNINFLKKNKKIVKIFSTIMIIILLSFSVFYIIQNYKILNSPPQKEYKEYGEFISENSLYEDVFFSTSYEIPDYPSLKMSYSSKRVYLINSIEDIYFKLKDIDNKPNIALFIPDLEEESLDTNLKMLMPLSYSYVTKNNMAIYKVEYDDFLKFEYEYPLKFNHISNLFSDNNFNELLDYTKELNNEEYLDIIYRIILKRSPDNEGYSHYLDLLNNGMSKKEIFEEFLKSPEYNKINSEVNS
jgi:hypothetical protein